MLVFCYLWLPLWLIKLSCDNELNFDAFLKKDIQKNLCSPEMMKISCCRWNTFFSCLWESLYRILGAQKLFGFCYIIDAMAMSQFIFFLYWNSLPNLIYLCNFKSVRQVIEFDWQRDEDEPMIFRIGQ